MSVLKYCAVVIGFFGVLWMAYGLEKKPDSRPICIEFASDEDQSFFNSMGVVRDGALISGKSSSECKGRVLDQVLIK